VQNNLYLPPAFVRNNTHERGGAGVAWLEQLPAILERCREQWSLRVGPPFEGLSYNYVAPAEMPDGTPAVLKLCVPDEDFPPEAAALRFYAGEGAVRLLEVDYELGAMLLERITPGYMLTEVESDEEATHIAAGVMRRLLKPAPEGLELRTIEDWGEGLNLMLDVFAREGDPFPSGLARIGRDLFWEMARSQGPRMVLHADLHHYNILISERDGWVAIDPHGVLGEAEYETGLLLLNPTPQFLRWPNLGRILKRRIDILAEELGFSRERIWAWGVAQAVLSAWWTYEGSGGRLDEEWAPFMAFIETLYALR
jgi:streptomycin 6-kinase